jgi:hypothetical protein
MPPVECTTLRRLANLNGSSSPSRGYTDDGGSGMLSTTTRDSVDDWLESPLLSVFVGLGKNLQCKSHRRRPIERNAVFSDMQGSERAPQGKKELRRWEELVEVWGKAEGGRGQVGGVLAVAGYRFPSEGNTA